MYFARLLIDLRLEPLRLGLDDRCPGAVGIGVERDQSLHRPPPVLRVERRLEHGAEAVIVRLRDRVVPVVMALGAADRQSQQRRADDLERVGHDLVGRRGLVHPAGRGAVGRHPQEARGGQRLHLLGLEVVPRSRHQLVAGKLLDEKAVERLVGVERPDDVVAVLVGIRPLGVVVAIAVGVGIAGDVQPVPRPPLTVMRRVKQAVDQPLEGIGAGPPGTRPARVATAADPSDR